MSGTDREVELATEKAYHLVMVKQVVDFFVISRRQSRRFRQKNDALTAAFLAGKARAYLNCARMLRRAFGGTG